MIRRIATATLIFAVVAGTSPALADSTVIPAERLLQRSIARTHDKQSSRHVFRPAQPHRRPRGTPRQHLFERIGAGLGLLGGGYLGVKIEGDSCHCDDPGLAGLLIGGTIGALVGGVIGFKLGR